MEPNAWMVLIKSTPSGAGSLGGGNRKTDSTRSRTASMARTSLTDALIGRGEDGLRRRKGRVGGELGAFFTGWSGRKAT